MGIRKYGSKQERFEVYKQQQNDCASKPCTCKICNCTIRLGNKCKHLRSKKHENSIKQSLIN